MGDRTTRDRESGPPPLSDDAEPEIDRVKLLRAWELNVLTQRKVLSHSRNTRWLSLVATLAVLAAQAYMLHRIAQAEVGFAVSQATMTGMLHDALTAQATVHQIEVEEKVAEVAMLAAAEPKKSPPGTMRMLPLAEQKTLASQLENARRKAANIARVASAPPGDGPGEAPAAPAMAAKRANLKQHKAAQKTLRDVMERLKAPPVPPGLPQLSPKNAAR